MRDTSIPRPVGSYPDSGMNVLIVGTGLAGLTAALECTRKGHRVRVLERNDGINTAGDMYFMGLSATRFFKHWPDMAEEYARISLHDAHIETFKHDGTSMIGVMPVADRLRQQGLDPDTPPGTFQMRPLVYEMFVKQCLQLGIEVMFGKRVVDYFEDALTNTAGVIVASGERYTADVVVAADGVGSKAHKLVGGEVRARSSGRAMWRAAFPIAYLDQNPKVKQFFKMHEGRYPTVRTWLGPSTYALTLTRPDTMIWIMNHDVTGSETESWNATIDADEVLAEMDKQLPPSAGGWAPVFKGLVMCTPPDTIVNFPLYWRNPKPTWASSGGRVVQIGDSAHSFLPASGNGATQAIEDAISLAECLYIGGKAAIPQSVGVHVRFRFVRNSCAQKLGFANAELLQETDWDKVKLDPRRAAPRLPRWVWSHDPEVYANQYYENAAESLKNGVRLEDEDGFPPNYPPGYRHEEWTIEQIMEDMRAGREVDLGPGDWS